VGSPPCDEPPRAQAGGKRKHSQAAEGLRLPQASDVETREPDESFTLQAKHLKHRVHPGVYAIPNFAQDVLGVDPGIVFNEMVDNYPVRKAGDAIDPKDAGWVDGANEALHYRGRPIKRCKIFAQRGPTTEGYRKYHYTGRQWAVMAAQVDVACIPELEAMADKYDVWCVRMSYPRPDHYIVTWYEDGTHSIDWHYDKLPDILEGSLITIVKLGDHARRFALRRRLFLKASSTFKWVEPSAFPKDSPERKETEKQLKKQKAAFSKLQAAQEAIFDDSVSPGTAIIMTYQANELTQHAVPQTDAERTGSVVFRSIKTLIQPDDPNLPASIRKKRVNAAGGRGGKRPRVS